MNLRDQALQAAREKRLALIAYQQQAFREARMERALKEINDRAAQSFKEARDENER